VQDVADHAFAAAFEDPRFLPVQKEELPELQIHISVLSPSEPLHFSSEEELLAQLRPGVDGLILHLGQRRATFLPAVWKSLPDPYTFLVQLKQKAGLPIDFWSDELQVERYTTDSFGET
jgi:AmmeMemoRadiSam system protein A